MLSGVVGRGVPGFVRGDKSLEGVVGLPEGVLTGSQGEKPQVLLGICGFEACVIEIRVDCEDEDVGC